MMPRDKPHGIKKDQCFMTLQLTLVAIIVAAAALYLARRAWRTWSARGCAGGCCKTPAEPASPPLIAADDLLGRVRQRQPGGPGAGAKTVDPGNSGSFST
jgi:hypothetical protein